MDRHSSNLLNKGLRLALALMVATLLGLTVVPPISAQEFRIESQIYIDSSKLPVSQNVTLFSQRIVYDFQMSDEAQPTPLETVVFDSTRRLMILLDTKRKIRLELPELRLIKILDSVRQETIKESRSSFLAKEAFREDNDWATGWVTLESPSITYRYKGERPRHAEILPPYYEFLDNFTRLIATDPTKVPPFARIQLNNSIRKVGWMPSEVQISIKPNALFREGLEAKSTHTVVNQLSNKDRERIAEAKLQWLNFRAVDLAEYRQLAEKPMIDLDNLDNLANKLESENESTNNANAPNVITTSYTNDAAPPSQAIWGN